MPTQIHHTDGRQPLEDRYVAKATSDPFGALHDYSEGVDHLGGFCLDLPLLEPSFLTAFGKKGLQFVQGPFRFHPFPGPEGKVCLHTEVYSVPVCGGR